MATGVQTFRPEPAVECLNEGVVSRFSRAREVERDASLVSPLVHVPGDELRALVHPDRLRIADLSADPLQGRHHVLAPVAEPRIEHRDIARVGIDHRQYAELATRRQLVVHEVHGPCVPWPNGLCTVVTQLGLHPSLRCLVPQLHAQLPVNAVGLLHVDRPAFAREKDMDPPVPEVHAGLTDLSDPLLQCGPVGSTRGV